MEEGEQLVGLAPKVVEQDIYQAMNTLTTLREIDTMILLSNNPNKHLSRCAPDQSGAQ